MNSARDAGVWRRLRLVADSVVDGDTLRMADPTPEAWGGLLARLRQGSDGCVPVRLAAVDAPESHYPAGPAALDRQPRLATDLSDTLLRAELAGFGGPEVCVQVLGVDHYGRAVGLVWPTSGKGEHDITATLNARLLACGACYPDFHPDLPAAFRTALGALVRPARHHGRGLWPMDASTQGFALDDLEALRERVLVLPRLFRRVADFWRQRDQGDAARQLTIAQQDCRGHDTTLAGQFREFLEQREKSLAARLSLDGTRCRVEGWVENFLHEKGCTAEKTDVAR